MSDNGDGKIAKFDEVEAESFVLRAPDGTKRAVLGLADDKAFLTLLDAKERPRISLTLGSSFPVAPHNLDLPRIELLDENGLVRLGFGLSVNGDPSMIMSDSGQNGTFVVGISPDEGGVNISITDEEGMSRVNFSLEEGTRMEFFNEAGKCIFSAPAKAKGPARKDK